MGTIANLTVKLGMDASDFDQGVKKASNAGESMVNRLSKLGGAMSAGLTVPILGIAAAAVKMSSDLNASMANIGSLGIGTDRLVEMKSAIQDLSIETGQSTADIADGMYQVVSAFGDSADALKILRTNAKAAKAGLATLPETIGMTAAVTKAWNDTSAEAVLHVADMGLKTVELGQTTLPELATSLQGVTLMSKSLGISQEEMFTVFAAATGVMGSAADVATKFRGAEQALMQPNANMIKAFKAMGVESGAALIKARGLGGAFVSLQKYADATGQDFTDLIGSVEGMQFAMFMGKDGVDVYAEKLAAMQNVVGKTDEAFLAQTAGINKVGFTMEKLQNYAVVLGQKLGDALAPVLATLLDRVVPLADKLVELVDSFVKMDPATQNWAIAGIALLAALGPLLLILPGIATGISAIAGAVGVMAGPIGLAILAVAILGAAWVTNFGGIQEKTAAVWKAIQPYITDMIAWIDSLSESGSAWLDVQNAIAQTVKDLQGAPARAQAQMEITFKAALDFADAAKQWAAWAGPEAQREWKIIAPVVLNFAQAFQQWAAWAGPEAQREWTLAVKAKMDFTQAAADWLAWAGPEAQREIDIIVNLPKNVATSVTKWWTDWQAGAEASLKTWQPATVSIGAKWEDTALPNAFAELQTALGKAVDIAGVWGGGVLLELWQNLQSALKEPIRIFGEWGFGVLQQLWQDAYDWLISKPITMNVGFSTGTSTIPAGQAGAGTTLPIDVTAPPPTYTGKAGGGPVSSGVPYLVGERGRELFIPNTAGMIVPNDEIGGWGGVTINNYGPIASAIDIKALAWEVAQYQKRRG